MIVVTGANGFIGANAALTLAQRGDDVIHVDDYPSLRGRGVADTAPSELRYERHERFRAWIDRDDLLDWLHRPGQARLPVRGVVHLGACSDTTITDRAYVNRLNLDYSRALWRWCAGAGATLVYASSAATYGDGSAGYDDAADPAAYRPLNLYAQSKHAFDLWALQQPAGDTPARWAGVKYFNVYGPRENHKQRMASMAFHWFHQVRDTGKARLFASDRADVPDGGQQRDFIHVADAVDATLHFLDTPASPAADNGLYNVGTGQARTFADLARAVFQAMDREPVLEFIPMPADLRGRYQYYTQATVARLRGAGFTRPFRTLEQGVAEYVAWLQSAAEAAAQRR